MNTDTKVLNKILVNCIQQHMKRIMHVNLGNVIHDSNRMKNKNHVKSFGQNPTPNHN